MSDDQKLFLKELKETHKKQRGFWVKLTSLLTGGIFLLVVTYVSTVSANTTDIKNGKEHDIEMNKRVDLIEKEKVDKELMLQLVKSYAFQTEILLGIKDGKIELAEQIIGSFEQYRLELLRDIGTLNSRGAEETIEEDD